MSIKERLKQSDSKLVDKRKEYESMLGEVKALKEVIQQKEAECTALEAELSKAKDPQVALTEELAEQSKQLIEREKLYLRAVESGALQEGAAQKDHRLVLVYRDEKDLRESLEQAHNKAQYREGQRKSLKEKLSLEIIVAKERVGEQVNTAVITPITTEQYQTYHHQPNQTNIMGMLTEWIAVNLVKAKVQPQSGEYNGFFKATIPGTPELRFDSELPDEFKEANINVEAVVLGEKEFVLSGEAVAVGETGEYTLSTGKKVDSTRYYDTGQTAELLGYKEGGSVLGILKRDAGRREKGIAPLLPAEKCSSYSGGGRVPWRVSGQSIIDFDEKRSGKSRAKVAAPPPKSVDEVVQPEVPESEVREEAVARTIVVPIQETFNIGEIAVILGVGYGCVGELVKSDPRSEQWKVKGQSKTGYVFKDIPRAVVEELAERYRSSRRKKVSYVQTDSSLVGVVGASRYIADRLKDCGIEYALSSVGVGLPAKTYAKKYLKHKSGLKLSAERGERNRILVRREGLDDFIDEYVKEEIIKSKVKAGKSYEEIISTLPDKYHASVNAFIAHRSHGDYKRGRKKAKKEPVTPTLSLEKTVEEAHGAEREAVAAVSYEDKAYLTTAEAAAIVGVTSRAIQNYIVQGKISAEKRDPQNPRCAWRISPASLDAYLVSIGRKATAVPASAEISPVPAAIVEAPAMPAEVPAAVMPAVPIVPVEPSPRPPLPEGELERRYQAIKSILGESYASKIRATTNGNIGDIEPAAFYEIYLPLLIGVWSGIREMYPAEVPEDFSPLCRPATFSSLERLARLEAKVNVHYSQFIEKNAEKKRTEREIADKVTLLNMYAGLDEGTVRALIYNLEPDGGMERIDALEKALIGIARGKATDAATKILHANHRILITQFDFKAYQTKLASTLEQISEEYTDEVVPDFYNPLQTPQNFTDVGALENVARVLKKAMLKKNRAANGAAASPDRFYYTKYASETAKAVEDDGFDLGMVCAIVDKGLNVGGRRRFGNKGIPGDVLKKTVSRFYSGRFNGKVYETNLRKMITGGAILEQDRSGKQTYSLTPKLSDSVPAHLREVLQPFYTHG